MIPLWFYWVIHESDCHWRNAHKYAPGFCRLLTGMGVRHIQEAAHLVVGIILHPAVGIPHLRDKVLAVIGVGDLVNRRRGGARVLRPFEE